MNYPKMLYKDDGSVIYLDSAQLKVALESKAIQTFIVMDADQEAARRDMGFVDLSALMERTEAGPKPKAHKAEVGEFLPAHDDLVAAYTAKHGKPPHHRMTDKTIAEAIA